MLFPFHHNKKLGQHFLKDQAIAQKIVDHFLPPTAHTVIEIGPGQGALTTWLVRNINLPIHLVEKDNRLISTLTKRYARSNVHIVAQDFLTWDFATHLKGPFAIIGNLPYNISSQIFFRLLEHHTTVNYIVCMVQKEVAERITAPPGSKKYGILSVLLQAFYQVNYLFTIPPTAFVPPPKVFSGVIKLQRLSTQLGCDQSAFFRLVKAAFHLRRKMLRNALRVLHQPLDRIPPPWLTKRAEELHVQDFVRLTNALYGEQPNSPQQSHAKRSTTTSPQQPFKTSQTPKHKA